MACPACGTENPAGARFCGGCGRALDRACPACGAQIAPGDAFCTSCGARAADAPADAPGEERKVVSLLFADVVGFTSRAERLDPEDVRALLSPLHARLRAEIERFGGSVEKFAGDAVLAVFGAPVAHEDDPERAVRAAFAVRDAGAAAGLELRLGIATGEALVSLGAGDWLAAGDVVNTAARLQQAAQPGGILVGEATYWATRDAVEYRPVEPVQAKGKASPVPAWEAVEAASPREGDRPARDAPLVGRQEDLALLLDAVARVRTERSPQLVTLVGVPGIGKSRLVFELLEALDAEPEPPRWLQGRSLPYGDGVTFGALAEMLKAHTGVLESDGAATVEGKLDAALRELAADPGEARWLDRHLRPLVGLPAQESREDRRSEAFAAWRRLFEALAERRALVLVFEDLHSADDALLDFVDELVEWLIDVPVLVVATTRPELLERRPGWGGGKRNAVTLSLAPLSEAETEDLLEALLERVRLPAAARRALVETAGGNPLYAGEYARMLVDRGFLRRDGGGWALESADGVPVPQTVQSIIAARIDTLAAEEKALLQDAAVLGERFWVGALATIGPRTREAVEEGVRALERKEFCRRERRSWLAGESQHAFRHVLVRDVAYGQIARARRAQKHRLAAEWLESITADRPEDQAEMLAHHYLLALEYARAAGRETAELAGRATRALREAGDRAAVLSAYAAAVRFYDAALRLLPPEEEEGRARAELLLRLGTARSHAAQEGEEELAEAAERLLALGEPGAAAEAEVARAALAANRGDREEALRRLTRASELTGAQESSRAKAAVLASSSRLFMLAGRYGEAVECGGEALALAETLGLDDLRAHAHSTIGASRFALGERPRGLAELERSLEVAVAIGSPESTRAYRFLASVHLLFGDLARSAELFAAGRRAAVHFGDAFNRRWLAAAHALEHYLGGGWDEALRLADEFVAESDAGAPHYMEAVCRRVRGEIRLARGDLAGALEDAERGIGFAPLARDPWFFHPSLAFHARALLAAGRADEAGAAAGELLRSLRELGPGSLVALEAVDLAVVLSQLGRGAELVELADGIAEPTLWLRAAAAHAGGDPGAAAGLYAEIGSLPDEALARLAAAEASLAAAEPAAAEGQLERALELYRLLGASEYLERAEALAADARPASG